MILTVTPNPAVDKSTQTNQLIPEKKLRCDDLVVEAGGGGINVSKGLQRLGAPNKALITSGGFNGQQLQAAMKTEGLAMELVRIEGETRENWVVFEAQSSNQFRFVLPGPTLTTETENALLEAIQLMPEAPQLIVGSGSLPPGFGDNFYAKLALLGQRLNAKTIIDCSGPALEKAVEAGVYLIKPNLHELSQLVGVDSLETDEVADAARTLLNKGRCEVVVVSLGAQGAMLITKDQEIRVPAPTVKKLSTVGAGDSMVAGMSYQIWKGADPHEMIRYGVACGTAATMNGGSQLFKVKDVERLYQWISQH